MGKASKRTKASAARKIRGCCDKRVFVSKSNGSISRKLAMYCIPCDNNPKLFQSKVEKKFEACVSSCSAAGNLTGSDGIVGIVGIAGIFGIAGIAGRVEKVGIDGKDESMAGRDGNVGRLRLEGCKRRPSNDESIAFDQAAPSRRSEGSNSACNRIVVLILRDDDDDELSHVSSRPPLPLPA